MTKVCLIVFFSVTFVSQLLNHYENHADSIFSATKFNQPIQGFFPENDLYIDDSRLGFGGITESDFNKILDDIERTYSSLVVEDGGRLIINRLWSDGTVNAEAYREGATYFVNMYGGLARHSAMTIEGLYVVACHEVGHHLGKSPFYSQSGNRWAAVEGQSDYFATAKCLRKVFAGENNALNVVDPIVQRACTTQWKNKEQADICMRSAMGGYATARMFFEMGRNGQEPAFDRPDPEKVAQTMESHPPYQCRLDTYFQGALCEVSDNENFSSGDSERGACTLKQKHQQGVRPRCWYKPGAGSGGPVDGIAQAPQLNGSTHLKISNPRQMIIVNYDVSSFAGAGGVYLEVSAPNRGFSNPNGIEPDPGALGGLLQPGLRGEIGVVPIRDLPDWGVYQIRVIPLGQRGQVPVGKFSTPSILMLSPR